jgi:hypothetical protein
MHLRMVDCRYFIVLYYFKYTTYSYKLQLLLENKKVLNSPDGHENPEPCEARDKIVMNSKIESCFEKGTLLALKNITDKTQMYNSF